MFFDMMQPILVEIYRSFGETCCPHLRCNTSLNGDSRLNLVSFYKNIRRLMP